MGVGMVEPAEFDLPRPTTTSGCAAMVTVSGVEPVVAVEDEEEGAAAEGI